MTLAEPLMLSSDVLVIRVSELPQPVREQIGEDGAFAVTRARGRSSSVLVDEDSADLLGEFKQPSTIADAVLRFSRRRQSDPQTILTSSYPALRRFLQGGYLVRADSSQTKPREVAFAPGERVAGGTVVRCGRVLDDTELYQLALDNGELAALKVLKRSASGAGERALRREAEILSLLEGRVSPRLLSEGAYGENLWLCMEWCEGLPMASAAAALRRAGESDPALLELCRRVAGAYRTLHEAGIVHADVHPGNLLASGSGEVRVIDFGLARRLVALDGAEVPPRGGVPPFFDPQYAQSLLDGGTAPEATAASDQYSLGAILFLLLTGSNYLDFSIAREQMLREIIGDPPLPFTRRGRAPWPEMEGLLATALEKDPGRRFASVADLSRRLQEVAPPTPSLPARRLRKAAALELLLDEVIAKAGPGGEWFAAGVPAAPFCSVAYGAAGIAAGLCRVGVLRSEPSLVTLADEWVVRAEREAGRPQAFSSDAMQLDERRTGPTTPYHRLSGVHAVQALVSSALGDVLATRRAIRLFIEESRFPCANIDVTLGRAGTVLGAAILLEGTAGAAGHGTSGLTELGNRVLSGIWRELDAMPPISQGGPLDRLGVAHGWAGLLLTTLRWCRVTGNALPEHLPERLDQLAQLAVPKGLGARWSWIHDPRHPRSGRSMPGWCNGTAGFVHLWTTAHTELRDERWAVLAEKAAWDTYTTQTNIAQLCCGSAGQAYALLDMYRHSGESRWLTAAYELGARAAASARGTAGSKLIPGSLHKGDVGIAVLAADLADPEAAVMPFFGSEL